MQETPVWCSLYSAFIQLVLVVALPMLCSGNWRYLGGRISVTLRWLLHATLLSWCSARTRLSPLRYWDAKPCEKDRPRGSMVESPWNVPIPILQPDYTCHAINRGNQPIFPPTGRPCLLYLLQIDGRGPAQKLRESVRVFRGGSSRCAYFTLF